MLFACGQEAKMQRKKFDLQNICISVTKNKNELIRDLVNENWEQCWYQCPVEPLSNKLRMKSVMIQPHKVTLYNQLYNTERLWLCWGAVSTWINAIQSQMKQDSELSVLHDLPNGAGLIKRVRYPAETYWQCQGWVRVVVNGSAHQQRMKVCSL